MAVKVIHILGTILPRGAELALLRILSEWKENTVYHSIYYLKGEPVLADDFQNTGIPTCCLNWKSERDFHRIPSLIRLFRKEKPDIVHAHLWTANYWIGTASRLAGVPFFVETIHDSFIQSRKGYLIQKALRTPFSYLTDCTICVSHGVKDYLIKVFHQPDRKINIIYNGLLDLEHNYSQYRSKMREEINIDISTPVFITIGGLVPIKKGYEIYLESLGKLNRQNKTEFHALIVGDTHYDSPEFLEKLKSITSDLNIQEKVTFLGYRSDIPELLCASDILIMPSLHEGGPIVVLEAMRAGKPVIASRTGAVEEYVRHSETGLIVEPGSSDELAESLGLLLENRDMWPKMGKNGRKRFLDNFTLDKTVAQLSELYKRLISERECTV